MFAKIIRALVVVICSATAMYEINIAPTAAFAIGSSTSGAGAG